MVLSAAVLSACGGENAINAAALGSNDAFFSQLALSDDASSETTIAGFGKGKMQMGQKDGRGGHGEAGFGPAGFGFLSADLNLTDAQKTEIQSILEAAKADRPEPPAAGERPTPPDASAIEAVQDKIKTAFLSESFDAAALHAEMESLHPAPVEPADHSALTLARAQQTLDIWNVLTAEQQATVASKAAEQATAIAEREANRPEVADKGAAHLTQLTEKLSLTEAQQSALSAAFEANRPAAPAKPDPQALITLLSSGSATAEAIAALHKHPEKVDQNPLSPLAALHSVLSAEQRQVFVDSGLLNAGRGPGLADGPMHLGGIKEGGFKQGPAQGGPGRGGHPMMGHRPGL